MGKAITREHCGIHCIEVATHDGHAPPFSAIRTAVLRALGAPPDGCHWHLIEMAIKGETATVSVVL